MYGGLTAWEHGEWYLAAEWLTAQPDTASPGRELLQAARLVLAADRREEVDAACIDQLRPSWEVDSLIAAYLLYAGIDLHGDAGRVEELVELVETADALLRYSWGPYQGSIRVAALLLGQAANHADHPDAPKTVSVHVSDVLAKLGAGRRGEAAAIARDRGLLE